MEFDAALKEPCLRARDLAYAPYSKFRVGAALLLEDGSVISGANVENASFGAGICAERSAIVAAMMTRPQPLHLKAIAVSSDSPALCSPCGICRQFIREFASLSMPVYMYTAKGELTVRTLNELLPLSFGPENLYAEQHTV